MGDNFENVVEHYQFLKVKKGIRQGQATFMRIGQFDCSSVFSAFLRVLNCYFQWAKIVRLYSWKITSY
jgi:hypothetical protein